MINAECSSNLACIGQKCQDPCPGSCGLNAECHVTNHIPICQCPEGFIGDPFSNCYAKPESRKDSLSFCNSPTLFSFINISIYIIQLQSLNTLIHATHRLVVQMLHALMAFALVYRIIMVIHTKDVDPNVLSTANVLKIQPVFRINAKILVLAHVGQVLTVMCIIIFQFVAVQTILLEIHLYNVNLVPVSI